MKYCNAVSVDAISLSKVSLLPEAEVKVESQCSVVLEFQERRLGESDTDC